MKKKMFTFLLLVIYILILITVFVLQGLFINGQISRPTANTVALVLTIPVIIVLTAFAKQDSTPPEKPSERTTAPSRPSDSSSKASEQALPEQSVQQTATISSRLSQLSAQYDLSRREYEVALLICKGYSNLQIAEELYISEATVKKHASHIYEKTGYAGRKAFRQAVENLPC